MQATHVVKDHTNNIIGFMVDGKFYTDYIIRKNIDYIDNLILLKNGTLITDFPLPEIDYKNTVIMNKYQKLVQDNPIERDIQNDLDSWKKDPYHKILQLEGTRQTGKTTELKKFAYKNYEYIIYVDLSDDKYDFLSVTQNGSTPLEFEKYCRRSALPHFVNSKQTILIIDEIQQSKEVYNSIRNIFSEINCDIIVTGSYLGRILGKNDWFLPAGTISYAYMFPLSFKEFCRVYNCDDKLESISLYGNSEPDDYKRLDDLYMIYRKIGGYPEVVTTYKRTYNLDLCYEVVEKLLKTFKEESRNYFENPREVDIFEQVYREAFKLICNRDDKTGKHVIEELTDFTNKNTSLLVNKNEIAKAIVWLQYSGIIGLCNLVNQGDMRDIVPARRMYFMDCGIMSYLATKSMIDKTSIEGAISENFVYLELHRLFKVPYSKRKVIEEEVCFSTYGDHELDFMVVDKENIKYGIEVKTKNGDPKSLKVYIDKKLIDKAIVAKYTKGSKGEQIDTIPIYAVGVRFPYK